MCKVKKRMIEERCRIYVKRKEWQNMENAVNEKRIVNMPIYKSQFHLCGPSEQIIPYYHKESHSCFRKQMRDKRVEVV
jgi:hypothetical protein